jgi:hypothetical protein
VFNIDREHPEYAARKSVWRQYQDLYVGGEQFKANAHLYLTQRQKETADVYGERLLRVFYENYVGSIIDWYSATLFRREPVITFDGYNEGARRFFGEFIEDCDLKGSSVSEFYRERFIEMLVSGKSHVLVDFPRWQPAVNRADEDQRGMSRAYLIGYPAENLINWSYDERGNYEWVVLRTGGLRKAEPEDRTWSKMTRWAYYDKQNYRIFEGNDSGEKRELVQVAEGRHGLAKDNRVPLFDLKVAEGLWLMNRAGLLQLEHFNKSNSLGWALGMGLFTMPVVYSSRTWNQMIGEAYYIQLNPEDKFGWTEPEGKVFSIAADNLGRLKDEIYRVCYLSQAAGENAGRVAQSATSKQRDFAITNEVLRAYGDAVKDSMKRVLRAIESARQDGVAVDVSGMDEFDIGDFGTELSDAERLLALGIESSTLKKQIFKKLALKYLCDVRQDLKDQIANEIEGCIPSKS